MKKLSIIVLVGAIVAAISCSIMCGCSNETAETEDEEIIKPVYLNSHNFIYPNIFIDTETGQEYIVFTYNGRIAAIPRLPKEKENKK